MRIRLQGYNARELSELGGKEAKEYLNNILGGPGSRILIEFDKANYPSDNYGRPVGIVYLPDKEDEDPLCINKVMLASGHGAHMIVGVEGEYDPVDMTTSTLFNGEDIRRWHVYSQLGQGELLENKVLDFSLSTVVPNKRYEFSFALTRPIPEEERQRVQEFLAQQLSHHMPKSEFSKDSLDVYFTDDPPAIRIVNAKSFPEQMEMQGIVNTLAYALRDSGYFYIPSYGDAATILPAIAVHNLTDNKREGIPRRLIIPTVYSDEPVVDTLDNRDALLGPMDDHLLRIGDCQFVVPPLAIKVTNRAQTQRTKLIRSKASVQKGTGHMETYIDIELYFHDVESINGKAIWEDPCLTAIHRSLMSPITSRAKGAGGSV